MWGLILIPSVALGSCVNSLTTQGNPRCGGLGCWTQVLMLLSLPRLHTAGDAAHWCLCPPLLQPPVAGFPLSQEEVGPSLSPPPHKSWGFWAALLGAGCILVDASITGSPSPVLCSLPLQEASHRAELRAHKR